MSCALTGLSPDGSGGERCKQLLMITAAFGNDPGAAVLFIDLA